MRPAPICFLAVLANSTLASIAFGEVVVNFSVAAFYALYRPSQEAIASAAGY